MLKNKKIYITILSLTLYAFIMWPITCRAFYLMSEKTSNYQDNLTNLIQAEMASNRNQPAQALEYYLNLAEKTKDPSIAKRATELAIDLQSIENAKKAVIIWVNNDPNSFQANMVATSIFISDDIVKTKKFITNAFKINPNEIQDHIFGIYVMLSKSSQLKFSDIMQEIADENKDNPFIQTVAANIVVQQNKIQLAQDLIDRALQKQPEFIEAIKLNAKLIRHKYQEDEPALQYLEDMVKKYPKKMQLRMFLASALLDVDKINKAIEHLKIIITDKEYADEANAYLGKIYFEKKDFSNAKTYFLKIKNTSEFSNTTKYFLGNIAEHEQDLNQAIEWYSKVYDGIYHIPAYIRASLLLTLTNKNDEAINLLENSNPKTLNEQKEVILTQVEILIEAEQFEEALDNINMAIEIIPNDIDFLYARSLIAGYLNNLALAEQDLSKILSLNPNHANALNALGYTLSRVPERRNDALTYLKKAISLSPNNPNYIDSMGWLLFQMGQMDEAISMLNKAYNLSKDSDIAAHLGKALWANGKRKQAINILKNAIDLDPNNQDLQNILNTFTSYSKKD